jgi:hypothetical protein
MYLRDERLRLYQASLEVTVTINRLSIYELSEWLSLFAVSIAVIDVQDTAYVIRDWVPYSVRNPAGIIHSRLNSNTPLSHKGNGASLSTRTLQACWCRWSMTLTFSVFPLLGTPDVCVQA